MQRTVEGGGHRNFTASIRRRSSSSSRSSSVARAEQRRLRKKDYILSKSTGMFPFGDLGNKGSLHISGSIHPLLILLI